jgi:hypothetical protein
MAPTTRKEPVPRPGCPSCPIWIKQLKEAWEKILQLDEQNKSLRDRLEGK